MIAIHLNNFLKIFNVLNHGSVKTVPFFFSEINIIISRSLKKSNRSYKYLHELMPRILLITN